LMQWPRWKQRAVDQSRKQKAEIKFRLAGRDRLGQALPRKDQTNMDKIITLAFTALLSLAATAQTVPSYTTQTASGTTTAAVCFASSPLQQIRLVSAIATSDLAGSTLCFRTGVTPHTAAYTTAPRPNHSAWPQRTGLVSAIGF